MVTSTRYEQPKEVLPLSEAMDRLFREAFTWPRFFTEGSRPRSGFGLLSNLYETTEGYTLQMVLPGVQLAELELTVHENVLTVRGKSELAIPEGARGIWMGLTGGEFREDFTLPVAVEGAQAKATYQDGILTVTLPKVEQIKVQTITVGTEA